MICRTRENCKSAANIEFVVLLAFFVFCSVEVFIYIFLRKKTKFKTFLNSLYRVEKAFPTQYGDGLPCPLKKSKNKLMENLFTLFNNNAVCDIILCNGCKNIGDFFIVYADTALLNKASALTV